MNKEEVLQKLFRIYRSSFNMEEPYTVGDTSFDAYGFCDITSAKYVLIKKAELWRAICYEHAFFKAYDCIQKQDIEDFTQLAAKTIEPDLVREGKACMGENHMYTYITGIFISEEGISAETKKAIKKARFFKNYRFSLRGYCEMRIVVIDLKNHQIIGNRAARDLLKDYKKLI